MDKRKQLLIAVIILGGLLVFSSCGGAGTFRPIESVSPGKIIANGGIEDWQAMDLAPLENLEWKNTMFNKASNMHQRRIKSVRLAHDRENIFLLLQIEPGIEEDFEQNRRSGHIGYIFLDTDGSDATGTRRSIDDKYAGWDYRIYLPTGFFSSTDATGLSTANPLASYKIEKLTRFTATKGQYGESYHCEYRDISGGERNSNTHPTHIAFGANYLEVRLPIDVLRMYIPTRIKLIIQDLAAVPEAEVEIRALLKK